MATNTYVALATTTLATSASSITVSNIPSAYTDLEIQVYAKTGPSAGNSTSYLMTFNGDTANNYGTTFAYGINTSVGSGRYSSQAKTYVGRVSSNAFTSSKIIINSYSNPNIFKSILSQGTDPYGYTIMFANSWLKSTKEAITSFTLSDEGLQNFDAGSTVTVYGIANADNFVKATGGIITEDATYTYHTFGSSGVFAPKQSLTADVLVLAGGGGGGPHFGGGGGAGGFQVFTSQTISTNQTITIGAGGGGGTYAGRGVSGVNTSCGSLISNGGGGGGGRDAGFGSGLSGGSGGGGTEAGAGGAASPAGQGFAGGVGNNNSPNYAGAGGGGAGAVGVTPANGSATGGNGGIGTAAYSSWGAVTGTGQNVSGTYYYAGGGSGGSASATNGVGGSGGGGNGATTPTAGLPNTGGGGGGKSVTTGSGGAGGSGLVIVRYAK